MTTILVIDDNKDIRENIAELLELSGYRTLLAENGRKGMEIAIREKPDVIVCDIMMPDLDGYGVLHLLKKNEETRHIPLIFLTAKTERSDFRKGMEMGADDYIPKPFEELELLNAIETRLKKTAIIRQSYSTGAAGLKAFAKDISQAGITEELKAQYSEVSYPKKHLLYQEGNRPRELYYLLSGKVKAFRSNEDGKEYINSIYGQGDFLGYSALIEDQNYEESAQVLEEATLLCIPREDFISMIYGDMSIASKFISIITRDVRDKEDRLLSMAYSSLRKRVAKALVDIHEKYGGEREDVAIEITRDDIARYIGTATESLIRTLSDFRSENLVEIRKGKIIIPDPEKLKNLLY